MILIFLVVVWSWALVDALFADRFRRGGRLLWTLVIAVGFIPGVALYLLVGRENRRRSPRRVGHPSVDTFQGTDRPLPRGPDDDPDFLRSL